MRSVASCIFQKQLPQYVLVNTLLCRAVTFLLLSGGIYGPSFATRWEFVTDFIRRACQKWNYMTSKAVIKMSCTSALLLRCLFWDTSYHAVRKPRSHEETIYRSFGWQVQLGSQPTASIKGPTCEWGCLWNDSSSSSSHYLADIAWETLSKNYLDERDNNKIIVFLSHWILRWFVTQQ